MLTTCVWFATRGTDTFGVSKLLFETSVPLHPSFRINSKSCLIVDSKRIEQKKQSPQKKKRTNTMAEVASKRNYSFMEQYKVIMRTGIFQFFSNEFDCRTPSKLRDTRIGTFVGKNSCRLGGRANRQKKNPFCTMCSRTRRDLQYIGPNPTRKTEIERVTSNLVVHFPTTHDSCPPCFILRRTVPGMPQDSPQHP